MPVDPSTTGNMKLLVAAFFTLVVVAGTGVSNAPHVEAKTLSSNFLDTGAKHATNQSVTTEFFLHEFVEALSEDEDLRSEAGGNFIEKFWSKVIEFFQKAEDKFKQADKAVNEAMRKAGEKVSDFVLKILGI